MLVIGSTATKFRKPKDLDLIATEDEFRDWLTLNDVKDIKRHTVHYSMRMLADGRFAEVEIATPGNSAYKYQELMKSLGKIEDIPVATDDIMFSIKKSHVHFPHNFNKHIRDYNILKDRLVEDVHPDITKIRFKETEDRKGILRTPKLKKSKEFFEQSQNFFKSYFVHDDMHDVMKHLDKPIYEYMQPDPNSALCSKEMWLDLPELHKKYAVMEESYVIALERIINPMMFGGARYKTNRQAFEWSLMRVCTTLCSGWFRQYACDNYTDIMDNLYDDNYVDKLLTAYNNNEIKMTDDGKNHRY